MDNEIKEQTRSVNNQDCVLNDIMNLQKYRSERHLATRQIC